MQTMPSNPSTKTHKRSFSFEFHAAAKLNNEGVELLNKGDLANARSCFHHALIKISSTQSNETRENGQFQSDVSQNYGWNHDPPTKSLKRKRSMDANIVKDSFDHDIVTDTVPIPVESKIIYSQAFRFPTDESSISTETQTEFLESLFIACCIFNLGLIYHMQGILHDGSSTRRQKRTVELKKAQFLYGKCFSLVFSNGIGNFVSKHPLADMLSMALLNNHSQLSHERCSFQEADTFRKRLIYVASLVRPSFYGNTQIEKVLKCAKDHFCLNTLLCRSPFAAAGA